MADIDCMCPRLNRPINSIVTGMKTVPIKLLVRIFLLSALQAGQLNALTPAITFFVSI